MCVKDSSEISDDEKVLCKRVAEDTLSVGSWVLLLTSCFTFSPRKMDSRKDLRGIKRSTIR